jgi:hypothetical protein
MTRTDAKKLETITLIVDTQTRNQNDEDGDKYLSDAYLAMEAIEAVLADTDPGQNGALRQYLEAR